MPPFECVFVNKRPYSNKRPHSNKHPHSYERPYANKRPYSNITAPSEYVSNVVHLPLIADILYVNTVSELEMAAQMSSSKIESLEESNKSLSLTLASRVKDIDTLRAELKKEKEKVLHLEEYSRRENLIFRNIPERPSENCRELIFEIIKKEMDIETSQMRCHAVHRMGKSAQGRPRPIIVRFVCREDKEVVFRKRNLLKESIHFPDAYITLDYPSEIQDERAVLIKAMLKAQASGTQAKVIGRTLKIGSMNYTSKNVPKELLE